MGTFEARFVIINPISWQKFNWVNCLFTSLAFLLSACKRHDFKHNKNNPRSDPPSYLLYKKPKTKTKKINHSYTDYTINTEFEQKLISSCKSIDLRLRIFFYADADLCCEKLNSKNSFIGSKMHTLEDQNKK